jgi:hypothetical protein
MIQISTDQVYWINGGEVRRGQKTGSSIALTQAMTKYSKKSVEAGKSIVKEYTAYGPTMGEETIIPHPDSLKICNRRTRS